MTRSLRILHVIETGGAGSGRHVIDLTRALAAKGHQIGIIYSALRIEPWFESAIAELRNVRSYSVPMRRRPHFSDLSAVRRIRRIIRHDGPFDIVHGHSSKGGAIARFAAVGTGCKVFYTPHAFVTMNVTLPGSKRFFYVWTEKFLAHLTDMLICVSSTEYDHAMSLGIARRRLQKVPNGLNPLPDVDRRTVREELDLRPEHVAIGFVGRLEAQKAVNVLISAFAECAQVQPSARLVIVGQGSDEQVLRQQAGQFGVADRIIWAGPANGARLMAGFDIYALSSIYEAFPYVLIEAAFRSLPIAATDVGGTRELVHDGVNGFVTAPGDIGGFAASLNTLVGDAATRKRLGAESCRLGENFTADAMAKKTLALYQELVLPN